MTKKNNFKASLTPKYQQAAAKPAVQEESWEVTQRRMEACNAREDAEFGRMRQDMVRAGKAWPFSCNG